MTVQRRPERNGGIERRVLPTSPVGIETVGHADEIQECRQNYDRRLRAERS